MKSGCATCLALAVVLASGCRNGAGAPEPGRGPDVRGVAAPAPVVDGRTGLTFPLDPPAIGPLRAVPVFEALSFERPVFLTHAPGSPERLFVVEQAGRVLSFEARDDVTQADVFLDIRKAVRTRHDEEGLLGLAFAPDYETSKLFFVYYSMSGPRRVRLSSFRVGPDQRAIRETERVVLEIEQPYGNHNGGMIAFGSDGHLYVGVGDGGAAGDPLDAGQDLGVLLGKILRIEVPGDDGAPYRIPADNPFVGVGGARPEIWAYGLRNPWRFSFDRQTGELWAGDVGQDRLEEIDLVEKGGNYGWRWKEGTRDYARSSHALEAPSVPPVVEYGRDLGASVTGGYVYRGTRLAAFRGAYFYGDYVTGNVWALHRDPTSPASVRTEIVARVPELSSFGEDARGELYAISLRGAIFRFVPAEEPKQGGGGFPTTLSATGLFEDTAALRPSSRLLPYEVNVELWSDGATKRRWLVLPEGGKIELSVEGAWGFPVGTVVVKHFELPDVKGHARPVRLETRVMVHERTGWAGYTYRWNEAQTDAELVTTPQRQVYEIERDGSTHTQSWYFPSGSDCLRCHTPGYGPILGLRTRQLARSKGADDALAAWAARGLFDRPVEHVRKVQPFAPLDDEGASLEARARGYLDVNCAICHHPGGPAPGSMDLRVQAPLAAMGLVGVRPDAPIAAVDARVHAGRPEASAVVARMKSRGRQAMPPLATSVPDGRAIAVIERWIASLGS